VSRMQSWLQLEIRKIPRWKRFIYDSLLALGSILLFTGLIFLLHLYPNVPDLFLAYLLVILALASIRGMYAALFASFLAFFLFDFLFIPPLYSLIVTKFGDVLALIVFLVTAVLTSQLADALRRRAEDANRRERETRILYEVLRATNHEDNLQHQLSVLTHSIVKVFLPLGVYDCLFLLPQQETFLIQGGTKDTVDYEQFVAAMEQVALWVMANACTRDIMQESVAYHKLAPALFQQLINRVIRKKQETIDLYYRRLIPLKTDQQVVGVLLLCIKENRRYAPFENGLGKEEAALTPQGIFFSAFLEQAVVLIERDRLRRESLNVKVLQETDALRAALLSSVSHDLRTPLSTIKTAVTSLQAKEVQWDEEARYDFTSAIERECDRLNELVENLLDMSRIEAGALQLEKMWYPLDELIYDVLKRMNPRLQGRDVRVNIPENLPPVEIDNVLIDQVVTNLLENAVNYTPAESPIDVSVGICKEENYVQVSVADRGPGIAVNERSLIFDKFYRVLTVTDAAVSHPSSLRGSGLGLAICRALVEAHGGQIWVEARQGGGAVFHFTLPLDLTEGAKH
jgi:two-component system, OmpR family, sensor histidine kinase KdpD